MQRTYWQVHVCVSRFNGLFNIQSADKELKQHRHKESHQTLFDIWLTSLMSVLQHVCLDIIPTMQYHAMGK